MADLKKVFIYVKADSTTNAGSLRQQVVTTSATDYNDRIFFLADTEEIVTHGHVFGVSKETVAHLENLDNAIKKITGVEGITADGTYEIVDDTTKSTIAKYVAKKMTTVSTKADSAVTVTPQDADGHKNYEVAVIADELTVVTKAGKLTSGLQLVYANKLTENKPDGIPANHPSMYLADKNGTMVGTAVDVNDFIVDGMISSVEYVAQGEDGLPAIKITWNADGENKVTYIPMADVFKLEEIHTGTPTYIAVKKTTPTHVDDPHKGDVDGGMCYEVNAVVDDTDLTVATTVTHTPADEAHSVEESYAASITSGMADNNFADISGLADSVKVAAKFKATDELIAAVANRAIERDKTLTAGIEEKIQALRDSLDQEVEDRTNGDADLQAKIDEINSTSEDLVAHPTSVSAKIASLRDSLAAELHAQDADKLISVSLKQEAGMIKDLAVTSKTDTLMSDVKLAGIDGQVTVGDKTYYVKDLNAISANDPALVTTQDAWLYGQALMTTVKSDNNQYIKVENNAGKLMIQYEPWAEIHSVNELNALYK